MDTTADSTMPPTSGHGYRRSCKVAKKRIDVNVQSTGLAGALGGGGGQYLATAYDENGTKVEYAYGATEQEARGKCVGKVRSRYGSDAEILY